MDNQYLDFFNYYRVLKEKVRGEILRESEKKQGDGCTSSIIR